MEVNPFSALAAKIYAGLFGASLAFVAVQTVRIDGLWFIAGLEQKLGDARQALVDEKADRETERADWRSQVVAAVSARMAAEAKSKEIADSANESHQALLADNAGLREYIAAHRLQPADGIASAVAAGATGNLAAELSPEPATGAFVATSEADLVSCDADYVYAFGAYEFVQELMSGGLAK